MTGITGSLSASRRDELRPDDRAAFVTNAAVSVSSYG